MITVSIDDIVYEVHTLKHEVRIVGYSTYYGREIGMLELWKGRADGEYQIGLGQLYSEYQGKGYYRRFISAAFRCVEGCVKLVSDDRNFMSNRVYRYWTRQEIGRYTPVEITQGAGGNLKFKVFRDE